MSSENQFATELAPLRRDMLRFARLQLRDDAAAEDAVQEAFIAAVEKRESFGGRASLARQRPASSGSDSGATLYNRGGFLAHGEALLADCRQHHRELTRAVFDCSDLLEARAIYGATTNRALIDSIARKLTVLAGNRGWAARTGPAQFAVAMPMSRDRAVHGIERALGNPCRIELEGNSEIVLVPVNQLVSIVAEGEWLHLKTTENESHTICYRLRDLLARLEPTKFVRLGRGTAVNIDMIRRILPLPGGTFMVVLADNQEFRVSRIQSRLLREQLLRL